MGSCVAPPPAVVRLRHADVSSIASSDRPWNASASAIRVSVSISSDSATSACELLAGGVVQLRGPVEVALAARHLTEAARRVGHTDAVLGGTPHAQSLLEQRLRLVQPTLVAQHLGDVVGAGAPRRPRPRSGAELAAFVVQLDRLVPASLPPCEQARGCCRSWPAARACRAPRTAPAPARECTASLPRPSSTSAQSSMK